MLGMLLGGASVEGGSAGPSLVTKETEKDMSSRKLEVKADLGKLI